MLHILRVSVFSTFSFRLNDTSSLASSQLDGATAEEGRSDEACLADKDDVGMQRIDTREVKRKNNIDQMFESLH